MTDPLSSKEFIDATSEESPADTFNLRVTVRTPPPTDTAQEETKGAILFDDKEIKTFSVMANETRIIETNIENVHNGKHIITVRHVESASPSSALIIEAIEMDEINIGVIAYQGTYTPNYPEPWYSDEVQAGHTPQEAIGNKKDGSSCLFMGWEGDYRLEFTMPMYEWLLEHL
tara:strand:+ start:747 stop:1265 length:519 start_codon:yes stop_codon:yes gene_type:complete